MRTRLVATLLLSTFVGGCELIVRFNRDALGGDAVADAPPIDVPRPDVPPADGADVPPGDTADVPPSDVADVPPSDAADVTPMDAVDVPPADVADVSPTDSADVVDMDTPADVPADVAGDATDASATDAAADSGLIPFNGCTPATAMDLTATGATRTINFTNTTVVYTPACIRIRMGQTVTFAATTGSFADHPLRNGEATTRTAQTGNPVTSTDTGMSAMFTYSMTGSWGFYCNFHGPSMAGTVYVEP